MSTAPAVPTSPAAAPAAFSRLGAFALILGGFALFLALVWLIGADAEFGGSGRDGQAHARANGLNGYAGFAQLIEADGFVVEQSRNRSQLETPNLLVLTPPYDSDAEEFATLLQARAQQGPTLVILPKWITFGPPRNLPDEARNKFKRGWVILGEAEAAEWTAELPAPYRLDHSRAEEPGKRLPGWGGLGLSGTLPTREILFAATDPALKPLIIDAKGRALAVRVLGQPDSEMGDPAYPVIFIAEPDLVNNYGLAEGARAAAALELVYQLTDDEAIDTVIFDLTLNGFGGQENLLTLAFRPPFLAATLCLLMALLIIGWRAFQRFGPPTAAAGPELAFGKQRLIANGASLIVRARRFGLLRAPYAALSARRIAERLGLARADGAAIDTALARRLPLEEPFTRRAARLEAAHKPAEILAAAQSLDSLAAKLAQGPSSQ